MKLTAETRTAGVLSMTANPQGKSTSKRFTFVAFGAIATLLMSFLSTAEAGSSNKTINPRVSAAWQKPAWLKEFSLRVQETYDSNIYEQNAGKLANNPSWVTTISPKLGLDFAPLIGNPDLLQVASLEYAPDVILFHDEPSQTYTAHRIATGLKGKEENFSYNFDNAFTYIDGNDMGPFFPQGLSAYSTVLARERVRQVQDRSNFSLRYDVGSFFIRPTASLLYIDNRTQLLDPVGVLAGYQNYPDRYDLNGGADLGYKINSANAITLGYRYGHQYQQSFPWDAKKTNASNDYQRLLVGFEGKPTKWLTLQFQTGPDFRRYGPETPVPVDDRSPVKVYAEGTAIAELTASDTLAIKYKRWSWLSCIGRNPYVDRLYDLSYRHKITSQLSLQAGARAADANYHPALARDDWDYTLSAGLRYAFTANLSCDIAYAYDWGRNTEDNLTELAVQGRQFERQVISFGTKWQF